MICPFCAGYIEVLAPNDEDPFGKTAIEGGEGTVLRCNGPCGSHWIDTQVIREYEEIVGKV